MGCFGSRGDLTAEEAAMVNGEYLLLYTEYKFEKYLTKLTSLAQKGLVSKKNFSAYAAELSLQHQDAAVVKVYEKYLKDDHYELKFLVSLAAILSKGSIKSKCHGILAAFKVETRDLIAKPKFISYLDLIFELSSVDLLKLAPAPDSTNNYTKQDFDSYVSLMQKGREDCKKEIIESLFVNKCPSIDLNQLLAWGKKEENHQWFSSITIRKALKHKARRILHDEKNQAKAKETEPVHHEPEKKTSVEVEVKVAVPEVEAGVETHHSHSHHSHKKHKHSEENKD